MVKKWLAAALAATAIGNGLFMIANAGGWYETAPGASDTGPFNPHFIWDVGIAFSVAGLGLAARAWRARYWPAALAGAGFLAGHGAVHVAGLLGGHAHYPLFELAGIVIPAFLSLWVALPGKGENHA
ncbi:hypothetical protein [Hyphococcus luteus]|uniref:DUF4345 domain-containing protein n=1 Tax=Hyphococcus luteus TaxID=2058213 RepID=A0A2S7JZQ7_9PROT|nr:hypothetical protein [Marinicaulis flavus]PQA85737.1 hypothetical protein CW354_22695 [Marinicaulis flavus]